MLLPFSSHYNFFEVAAPWTNTGNKFCVVLGFDAGLLVSFGVLIRDAQSNTVDAVKTDALVATYSAGTGTTMNINGSQIAQRFFLQSKRFLIPPGYTFFIAAIASAFVMVIECQTLDDAMELMKS